MTPPSPENILTRWRAALITTGLLHLLITGYGTYVIYSLRGLRDEGPVDYSFSFDDVFTLSPLLTYAYYVIAPMTPMRLRMSLITGLPLHVAILAQIVYVLPRTWWGLIMFIGPLCWALYLKALSKYERRPERRVYH